MNYVPPKPVPAMQVKSVSPLEEALAQHDELDKLKAKFFPKEQPKAQPRISIITPGETFSMHWVAAHRQVVTNLCGMGIQVWCWNGFSSSVFSTRIRAVRSTLENHQKNPPTVLSRSGEVSP